MPFQLDGAREKEYSFGFALKYHPHRSIAIPESTDGFAATLILTS
jgi:hypothetical protein